ncbi:MAG TPA: PASTA domain-containing protein [Pyrinomonadaceae bacterium]|nr:PASTA domain-containing protein [Pyrinomonadaceae bacterium]
MALRGILSAFGKLGLVALLAVAFAFGLLTTVYLSLRSPNITVPDVAGKSYTDGENILSKAGLDIRERASRYKQNVPPGVIIDQSPHAGEVIKGGQTVAVVVSRAPKEGEQPVDETVAAERSTERGTEGLDENRNTNANRRKPVNRNSNGNSNSNAAANSNTGLNSNGGGENTNARNANAGNSNLPVNRNANRNSNTPANTNANRNRTTNSNAGLHIVNPTRPAGANANRRPTP